MTTAASETYYQRLKSFGLLEKSGANPNAGLIRGSDGRLYGTTTSGGRGSGTVFMINPDGTAYGALHSFNGDDGAEPYAGLLEGTDGALYGTTRRGGANNAGTVFKLKKDGASFAVLHSFTGSDREGSPTLSGDGSYPLAALIEGKDGALYGTTSSGGTEYHGIVFKLNKDGTAYAALHRFSVLEGDGPVAGLLEDDGMLYGLTRGTIFKMKRDGTDFMVLHSFSGADGALPLAGLIRGSSGEFFGTTSNGGSKGLGTVFRLTKDGSHTVLHSFTGSPDDGYSPETKLMQGSDGALYGVTKLGGGPGTIFKLNPDSSGYRVLHQFVRAGGSLPKSDLLQGNNGTLFGTTLEGGVFDQGTIFKMNPDGSGYTILHSFSRSGGDGSYPQARLLRGSDGWLYGATSEGGPDNLGTVFRITPRGDTYTMLHSFDARNVSRAQGVSALVEGEGGVFYAIRLGPEGALFKVNKDGSGFAVLHSFPAFFQDGSWPLAAPVLGNDGALYGTTSRGGTKDWGIVFKVKTDGTGYTVLLNHEDNYYPGSLFPGNFPGGANLTLGKDGEFYGVTGGGGNWKSGTVFKLNSSGASHTILYAFNDVAVPKGRLLYGSDGALYGTTYAGGSRGQGRVFKLNRDGTGYVELHAFAQDAGDASFPATGLAEAEDGTLYGTTSSAVYRLNKDGSGYTILRVFAFRSAEGWGPSDLIDGNDGAFYGIASSGGDMNVGTVFKIFFSPPAVRMNRIESTRSGVQLTLSGGAAGQTVQIQATDAIAVMPWESVGSSTATVDGSFQFLDAEASNHRARFYRGVSR